MSIHTTTGRWRLGLALTTVTAVLWGILPIALKVLLDQMDAYTITWYRFSIAAVLLMIFIVQKKKHSSSYKVSKAVLVLIVIAAAGLCGNYILYVLGLNHLSPSTATVVIQLAPIFMLFGSLIVFKERFNIIQWSGFIVLVFGLVLFFNDRLDELLYRLGNYTIGVLLIVASGAVWSVYALAQKQLLKSFPSETIMLIIYITGMLLFFPFAEPMSLGRLNSTGILLLCFCAVNTLIAYGSFAEALDHLDASRISMVLATIPLITMVMMKLCLMFFPDFIEAEKFNFLSIIGALLVVAGSMLCVFSRKGKEA